MNNLSSINSGTFVDQYQFSDHVHSDYHRQPPTSINAPHAYRGVANHSGQMSSIPVHSASLSSINSPHWPFNIPAVSVSRKHPAPTRLNSPNEPCSLYKATPSINLASGYDTPGVHGVKPALEHGPSAFKPFRPIPSASRARNRDQVETVISISASSPSLGSQTYSQSHPSLHHPD